MDQEEAEVVEVEVDVDVGDEAEVEEAMEEEEIEIMDKVMEVVMGVDTVVVMEVVKVLADMGHQIHMGEGKLCMEVAQVTEVMEADRMVALEAMEEVMAVAMEAAEEEDVVEAVVDEAEDVVEEVAEDVVEEVAEEEVLVTNLKVETALMETDAVFLMNSKKNETKLLLPPSQLRLPHGKKKLTFI